jgi:hypothetical protein
MIVYGMSDVYNDVILVHVVYMTDERSAVSVIHVNRKTTNFGWLEI